jgi:hypothetical protein
VADLVQQRSMLVILLASCKAAQTAFEAADNAIDAGLRDDLTRMIDRSEDELAKLTLRIEQAGGQDHTER